MFNFLYNNIKLYYLNVIKSLVSKKIKGLYTGIKKNEVKKRKEVSPHEVHFLIF